MFAPNVAVPFVNSAEALCRVQRSSTWQALFSRSSGVEAVSCVRQSTTSVSHHRYYIHHKYVAYIAVDKVDEQLRLAGTAMNTVIALSGLVVFWIAAGKLGEKSTRCVWLCRALVVLGLIALCL
jgi:hypothetical protein